jgi:hypothetical protein
MCQISVLSIVCIPSRDRDQDSRRPTCNTAHRRAGPSLSGPIINTGAFETRPCLIPLLGQGQTRALYPRNTSEQRYLDLMQSGKLYRSSGARFTSLLSFDKADPLASALHCTLDRLPRSRATSMEQSDVRFTPAGRPG